MKLIRLPKLAALAAALALAATPAFAQHDRDQRGGEHQGQAQPRGNQQRGGEQRGAQPHGNQQQNQRRGDQQRGDQQQRGNRGAEAPPRGQAPRGTNGRIDRGENRGSFERGRAVPRPNDYRGRAYEEPRGYGYERPHADIRVRHYDRPYFAFRPHFLIGYGIYLGYPVPYPIDYGVPTYVYGYPAGAAVAPNSYGGISLDITPDDAQVSVDGAYVGVARDFSPSYQPLTLTPGRHHVELQAPGAIPLAFDVDVAPGEVIPYRGTLQPE